MPGAGLSIRSNLGYSVLPNDTSACRKEEAEIEPLTLLSVDTHLPSPQLRVYL